QREAAIAKRLDRLDRRQTRLERDVGIGVEMIALFVRFWLSNTPPPPETERTAMRRLGNDRYEAFIEALGRRLAKGPKVRQEIGEDVEAAS
ncbi:MAG: CopG family transcriptional regulator, partial [Novosphingobium sp.]